MWRSLFLCLDKAELAPCDAPMSSFRGEPTLDEILSDPIVRALMEADGVDRQELEAMLSRIARRSSVVRHGDLAISTGPTG